MKVIVDKRFKEEMLTNYIPRIEIMIKKEKEQIKYLEEHWKLCEVDTHSPIHKN